MEQDNLKQLWQQYDQQLDAQKPLEEQAIRQLLQEKSNRDIKTIYTLEIISLLIVFVIMTLVTPFTVWYSDDWRYVASGCVVLTIAVADVFWQFYKIRFLSNLNLATTPVAQLAAQATQFKLYILRERLAALFLVPLCIGLMLPTLRRAWGGELTFEHPQFYALLIGVATLLGIGLSLWFYRTFYLQKIEKLQAALRESTEK